MTSHEVFQQPTSFFPGAFLSTNTLTLATRGSGLALQQSNWVKAEIERLAPGIRVEILTVRTTGDRMKDEPLPQIGGKGLFTKEIEEALLEGRAHLAVHSLKDLPTEIPAGLILAAVPRREDPRDVLVSRDGKRLAELSPEARVGTSSVRRAAQLKHLRPDLQIEPLRGNLDTRLRKLREGRLDAIVLAAAGLVRMGLAEQITEYFAEETLCPAVGQGALGIEARAEDEETLRILALLEDRWARVSTTAERSLLRHLGGGCQVPIAAISRQEEDRIRLTAVVIHPDGNQLLRSTQISPPGSLNTGAKAAIAAAEALGKKTAENLLQQGAGQILQLVAQSPSPFPAPHTP
ncbi:MAG: hydroxymethylbilane synthase [Acidobacteria bacterium]|nr:hydroxymethylbilane synthase [Acidobacteriota bacterium]